MVYIFLAEGFEEIEALCPLDLLRRAGVAVKTVGIGGKSITGSHGITVLTDMCDSDYSDKQPEMVILPGGVPGTPNLEASEIVKNAVLLASQTDAFVAAICAAPSILGKMGLLQGKEAICFPSFESALNGAKLSDKKVVKDGKFITGAGMGVALDFGIELVRALKGDTVADSLRKAVLAD